MHILVIDGGHVETEFREKFGPGHGYTFLNSELNESADFWTGSEQLGKKAIAGAGAVFQFGRGVTPDYLANATGLPLFVDTSCGELPAFFAETYLLFGFCGLPSLLNRHLLEVSLCREADREKLAATCVALGTDYRVVADRVGLVTPRVVCMVINEACYTVQEGTATMQDVDLGMRLGTGYPRGPFAWANAIGVARVHAVLDALWHDTHDERYKICPLLKRQAQRGEPFAV